MFRSLLRLNPATILSEAGVGAAAKQSEERNIHAMIPSALN